MFEGFPPLTFKAAFSYDIDEEKKLNLQFRLMTKIDERKAQEDVKAAIVSGTGLPLFNVLDFTGIAATK